MDKSREEDNARNGSFLQRKEKMEKMQFTFRLVRERRRRNLYNYPEKITLSPTSTPTH